SVESAVGIDNSPTALPKANEATQFAAGRCLPETQSVVGTRSHNILAAWQERDGFYPSGVALKDTYFLARSHIPQPRRAVFAAGQNLFAIWCRYHRRHLVRMTFESEDLFAGKDVP